MVGFGVGSVYFGGAVFATGANARQSQADVPTSKPSLPCDFGFQSKYGYFNNVDLVIKICFGFLSYHRRDNQGGNIISQVTVSRILTLEAITMEIRTSLQ